MSLTCRRCFSSSLLGRLTKSREFVMMLAERRAADVESWLTQAEHSGLPEFKKMAKGIRQDDAAVKAAFASEWSNGQVEGQVNCLKLEKRLMFGRAKFDLLRQRVLSRDCASSHLEAICSKKRQTPSF
jgi:transposase